MKLAFISTLNHALWGGSEALWSETAKLAIEKNHKVFTSTHFWEDGADAIAELAQLGAQTFYRKVENPTITKRLYNWLKRKIIKEQSIKEPPDIKALKEYDPDVILISQENSYSIANGSNAGLLAYMLTTAKPYFIICHSYSEDLVLTDDKRDKLVEVYSKARAVFMICQTQAATVMKQLVCRLPNIKIVNNPINLKEVRPAALPSFNKVQFASVASLYVDTKGQDMVLEVLSREKWKSRDWQYNLYGDGPHRKYLEQLIIYFGLEGRVVLKGHAKDINAVWAENHLLLLSSRIETGPMVLTEAMLCGRTIVTTRVGKVPEVIQDGYNGYIADAATVKLFDEALERAWQNKEQWAAMGERACQSALDTVDLQAPATFLNLLINTK